MQMHVKIHIKEDIISLATLLAWVQAIKSNYLKASTLKLYWTVDTPLKAWSLCSIYLDEVVWTLAGTVHWFTVSELCVAAGDRISTTLVNHRKQSNDQWSVEVLNTNIRNILLNHWLVRELSTHSEKYHDIIIIILVSVGAFSDYLSQYWCKKNTQWSVLGRRLFLKNPQIFMTI